MNKDLDVKTIHADELQCLLADLTEFWHIQIEIPSQDIFYTVETNPHYVEKRHLKPFNFDIGFSFHYNVEDVVVVSMTDVKHEVYTFAVINTLMELVRDARLIDALNKGALLNPFTKKPLSANFDCSVVINTMYTQFSYLTLTGYDVTKFNYKISNSTELSVDTEKVDMKLVN